MTRIIGGSAGGRRLQTPKGDLTRPTSDGFKLADLDLELRREGDVLGKLQSGKRSTLRLLSVVRDVDVIEDAREAAIRVVEADPELAEDADLRAAIEALQQRAETDYLDKA